MVEKIKREMARLGWNIEERISDDGWDRKSKGYSIWFKRPDWHGKNVYTITGHEVCFHGHIGDFMMSQGVLRVVKETATKAKQAWNDFPDSIPYQTSTGEVVKDKEVIPFAEGKDYVISED